MFVDGWWIRTALKKIIDYICWKKLPEVCKDFKKSSLVMTLITGSTTAGEVIPPHFQLLKTSQREAAMQL